MVGGWLRRPTGRVRVIDAPVSGGSEGAQAGTLSIMVGGDERDVNDAWPVLAACGNPVHLGPLGSGQVAKACNQMIVAATVLALGEAAVLADRSGLDLDELFRLLAGGYAGSRILETRGDRIVREDYSPSGAARYMVKDLRFAATVAQATGTHRGLASSPQGGIRGTHRKRVWRPRHRRHAPLRGPTLGAFSSVSAASRSRVSRPSEHSGSRIQ